MTKRAARTPDLDPLTVLGNALKFFTGRSGGCFACDEVEQGEEDSCPEHGTIVANARRALASPAAAEMHAARRYREGLEAVGGILLEPNPGFGGDGSLPRDKRQLALDFVSAALAAAKPTGEEEA